MKMNRFVMAGALVLVALASLTIRTAADDTVLGSGKIRHVLLLSIDGMHALIT